jgi:hypothetical protein
VEEQVALDRLVVDKSRPATSAHVIAFVGTVPGEFDTGTAMQLGWAAVHPTAHGDESELPRSVPFELDETWLDEVDRVKVPLAHLDDPPPANQPRCGLRSSSCHETQDSDGWADLAKLA